MPLPRWVEPQLAKLVEKAPTGPQWVHEIKFDGYSDGRANRTGEGSASHPVGTRLDGKVSRHGCGVRKAPGQDGLHRRELCGVRPDGVTSFELMQQSSDAGYGDLIHFAFDLD